MKFNVYAKHLRDLLATKSQIERSNSGFPKKRTKLLLYISVKATLLQHEARSGKGAPGADVIYRLDIIKGMVQTTMRDADASQWNKQAEFFGQIVTYIADDFIRSSLARRQEEAQNDYERAN